jgi:CDP-diacylglycerol---glycerol-3-phosphate 3-phosphatidyltransferase
MTTERPIYGPTALLTPANMMTAFRLLIAPVLIYLVLAHRVSWWTTLVGLLAGASDYFDGIIARRHGTTTSGAFLDPLADKVIVLGSLYAIVLARPHGISAYLVPTIIITLREAWMSAYRARAARRGISIPASKLAKWKTFLQDWAIGFAVLPLTGHHEWIGITTVWVAVVLTVYTGWDYYAKGRRAEHAR